ncbi:MAG: glycoside hydrolase family 9 protein [Chitinophagaceae bacterium]
MKQLLNLVLILFLSSPVYCVPVIYINQVGFNSHQPKIAVIGTDAPFTGNTAFNIIAVGNTQPAFTGTIGAATQIAEWNAGKYFYRADFSAFRQTGKYILSFTAGNKLYTSDTFSIAPQFWATDIIPSILHYYRKQRANTPKELAADAHMLLYGSTQTVNIQGGWCDASGDVSKYFSHLAYTNLMLPQQTPMVTWSLINTREAIPGLLIAAKAKDSIESEALWGADYIMRSLSPEGYFYMTVFSYFKPDPSERRIVGLLANSVTTSDYQCAFREGGGMAIAALARISRWKMNGSFTSQQYLEAAKRAFAHLLVNNLRYTDDGKENILDDYCALMAATELWITTGEELYRDQARKRAANLRNRITPGGYFIANDANRPFWHAADAGLPVIALVRYVQQEKEEALRTATLQTIRQAVDYIVQVTNKVSNPFGYARQTILYKGTIQESFFIPHQNESGWWWQGENARLASLASAVLAGSKILYNNKTDSLKRDSLQTFASMQLSWILGCNPYSMCFLYGWGKNNVPYMASQFGHGSEKGGISNGITGKDGNEDGSGIDFKTSANGNEWRWTEQWIPHAAWFLQAVTALSAQ